MYSELDTFSHVCIYTLGNLDGNEICNKILLMLLINSLSTCFRKGIYVWFILKNGMAFL